jgi:enterochelin esterase-like enzyme
MTQAPAGAGIYGRFVMGEVVPYLAREFGVRTDRDGIAMGGASLGGLVTLAIARQFPGRIGRLLVMSPSVWWDKRVILRRLQRVGLAGRPARVARHRPARRRADSDRHTAAAQRSSMADVGAQVRRGS